MDATSNMDVTRAGANGRGTTRMGYTEGKASRGHSTEYSPRAGTASDIPPADEAAFLAYVEERNAAEGRVVRGYGQAAEDGLVRMGYQEGEASRGHSTEYNARTAGSASSVRPADEAASGYTSVGYIIAPAPLEDEALAAQLGTGTIAQLRRGILVAEFGVEARAGAASEDVVYTLQSILIELGHLAADSTEVELGIIGSETELAVTAFQQEYNGQEQANILREDGVVDADTLGALKEEAGI